MLVRSIENGGCLVGSPLVTNSSVLTRTKPFALHARSKAPLLSKRPIDGWSKCHAWSRLVCTGLHIGQAPTHISCTQVIAPSPQRPLQVFLVRTALPHCFGARCHPSCAASISLLRCSMRILGAKMLPVHQDMLIHRRGGLALLDALLMPGDMQGMRLIRADNLRDTLKQQPILLLDRLQFLLVFGDEKTLSIGKLQVLSELPDEFAALDEFRGDPGHHIGTAKALLITQGTIFDGLRAACTDTKAQFPLNDLTTLLRIFRKGGPQGLRQNGFTDNLSNALAGIKLPGDGSEAAINLHAEFFDEVYFFRRAEPRHLPLGAHLGCGAVALRWRGSQHDLAEPPHDVQICLDDGVDAIEIRRQRWRGVIHNPRRIFQHNNADIITRLQRL